jgi:hypothetical protein
VTLTRPADYLDPVHPRHCHVHQQEIHALGPFNDIERSQAVLRCQQAVPEALEAAHRDFPHVWIVVDHRNGRPLWTVADGASRSRAVAEGQRERGR